MRRLLPMFLVSTLVVSVLMVPAILMAQTAAPKPIPLAEAEGQYLEAWDYREGNEAIPVPVVSAKDRPALRWLISAADQVLPANPFPKNGPSWREAEAVRRLLSLPPAQWAQALKPLHLTLGGSYLALWRWGQPRARDGRLDKDTRIIWEDKLLGGKGPAVERDLALRHALCFALAAADGERFAQLKDRLENDFPDFFPQFQNAFALIGAPAPVVHLWTLPNMESVDISLAKLGGSQLRFEPDPVNGLPELPPGTVWVIPTREGSQPEASIYLEGNSLDEANRLIPRLEAAKRTAFLAPVRTVFETYALMYFPIQIDLDEQGNILKIRMGDAARAKNP